MNKLTGLTLILLPVSILAKPGFQNPQARHLTLLHINDMHAQYAAQNESGGMIALDRLIRENRDPGTLLLDAGDTQTGTMLSFMEYRHALGGGFIEMMNRIGFDATVLGNHDFDGGWPNTRILMEIADFPVLSANCVLDDSLFADAPFAIFTRNGLRIGVIGLTTEVLPGMVKRDAIRGIQVLPVRATAQKIIDDIDDRTDLIILLTHQGIDADSTLAAGIHDADIIVGGHSHTLLKKPKCVNGILIVHAGSRTRFLGRMDLEVRNDRIGNFQYRSLPVQASAERTNPGLTALVDSFSTVIDASYNTIIGNLDTPWIRAWRTESNVGDFIADVLKSETGADFAVLNSGAIRKNMTAGPVTIRDIYELLPFGNETVTLNLTGSEIEKLVNRNARSAITGKSDILQISGLRYRFRESGDGSPEIIDIRIGDSRLEPGRIYRGASIDFVIRDQAKDYLGFVPDDFELNGYLLHEQVIKAIMLKRHIRSTADKRIEQID
ncbi:bifunctional metallophosphatase/5'-nucleotidase [bacterium]|nr:bifunctional metallophosphatase/5'-nucleotidase [bacterium]